MLDTGSTLPPRDASWVSREAGGEWGTKIERARAGLENMTF